MARRNRSAADGHVHLPCLVRGQRGLTHRRSHLAFACGRGVRQGLGQRLAVGVAIHVAVLSDHQPSIRAGQTVDDGGLQWRELLWPLPVRG